MASSLYLLLQKLWLHCANVALGVNLVEGLSLGCCTALFLPCYCTTYMYFNFIVPIESFNFIY